MGFEIIRRITRNIEQVMQGQSTAIRWLMAACASGGHVLVEDVPGTGKTTLAKAFARSVDLQFQRIQFTPDLLPSDILGVTIFNPQTQRFHLHQGPVFTDVLLADEINRASPRTQSALLEAMAEGQVSLDRRVYSLNDLFTVIATQNPIEAHGTYPLPEAQLDRFALRFSLGYVTPEQEIEMLTRQTLEHPLQSLAACTTAEDLRIMRQQVREVRVSAEVKRYIVDIVAATRAAKGVQLGAGSRASLALMKTAQALAMSDNMVFVTPEHVQELAVPVLSHRLALDPQARFAGQTPQEVITNIIKTLPVPA
jgi:MoxR-like ATPase